MNPAHDITVVCPTFNSADFLGPAFESILGQTELPAALVVADDGSEDNTVEVVSDYFRRCPFPTKLLRNSHRGPGAARNAGVAAAATEWIAFLDSDDFWLPSKLARIAAYSMSEPSVNLFCHNEEARQLDGRRQINDYGAGFRYDRPVLPQFMRQNRLTPSGVVCRRELFEMVGGFDEDLMYAEDYDLWLKMAPHLRLRFVPEALGVYVERHGNLSSAALGKRMGALLSVKRRYRQRVGVGTYALVIARLWLAYAKGWIRSLQPFVKAID